MSDDLEEIVAVGSIKELEELSGVSPITDIHRERYGYLYEDQSYAYAYTIGVFLALITSPFLPRLDVVSFAVLKKSLIAGSSLVLCLMLSNTILSRTRTSSRTLSPPISFRKVLIRLVVGSTLCSFFRPTSSMSHLPRMSLSAVWFLLRKLKKVNIDAQSANSLFP